MNPCKNVESLITAQVLQQNLKLYLLGNALKALKAYVRNRMLYVNNIGRIYKLKVNASIL